MKHDISIRTPRMVLVAATLDLASAERESTDRLASALGAVVPGSWPPPLNDDESAAWFLNLLKDDPAAAGWGLWYFLVGNDDGALTAAGNGGFKGRPSPDGHVEIGYSVLDQYQRNGLASEAVIALLDWAFQHEEVETVIAHTLPDLTPSIRVLEKCGFRFAGAGPEQGTIRYERPRSVRRAVPNPVIRRFRPDDTDALVAIWESASSLAHPFLAAAFMAQEAANLRSQHLPGAETWVLEIEGGPVGFIALLGDEIGGLFLDPTWQRLGFGKALVDHAVGVKGVLHVEVFERNEIGRRFYSNYGFVEASRYVHDASGERILRLKLPSPRT